METLWNAVARLARYCAWLGGALLLVAAVLVSTEVLSRKLLTFVYSGSDELAAYLFAAGTALSLAHVLITRGHVRIDALYLHLPARVRAVMDVVALLLMLVLAGTLIERGFDLVHTNFTEWNRSNTPLRTPLALPQIPWLLGLALFFVSVVLALARTLLAHARGDSRTAQRTAGVSTQDEEIEGELASLGIGLAARSDAGRPEDGRPEAGRKE